MNAQHRRVLKYSDYNGMHPAFTRCLIFVQHRRVLKCSDYDGVHPAFTWCLIFVQHRRMLKCSDYDGMRPAFTWCLIFPGSQHLSLLYCVAEEAPGDFSERTVWEGPQ